MMRHGTDFKDVLKIKLIRLGDGKAAERKEAEMSSTALRYLACKTGWMVERCTAVENHDSGHCRRSMEGKRRQGAS